MPMERAPFGCLTDKPSRYMITPMLKCVTPGALSDESGGDWSDALISDPDIVTKSLFMLSLSY